MKEWEKVKIDKRRKYILVIDIETANMIDDAFCYDIGFAVSDKKGNIYYKDSLMIAELFFDNKDLLQTAYYKEKIPNYWKDYKQGKRRLVTFLTAKIEIRQIMKYFNIKDIFAYNARFDYTGLNRTERYLTKSKYRYFFPYGTKVHCILKMTRQVLFTQKSFKKFAEKNDLKTPTGKFYSNSAETAYKYMKNNSEFIESHTGLEDVLIECEILARCFRQNKKMETLLW